MLMYVDVVLYRYQLRVAGPKMDQQQRNNSRNTENSVTQICEGNMSRSGGFGGGGGFQGQHSTQVRKTLEQQKQLWISF